MGKTFDFFPDLIEELFYIINKSIQNNEIPSASIIFKEIKDSDNKKVIRIISSAHNRNQKTKDATAHAELLAIKQACTNEQNERLNDLSLLTALEPCCMCSGAIVHSRIKKVYYLLPTDKGPGLKTLLEQSKKTPYQFNHYPEIYFLERHSHRFREILTGFFEKKR